MDSYAVTLRTIRSCTRTQAGSKGRESGANKPDGLGNREPRERIDSILTRQAKVLVRVHSSFKILGMTRTLADTRCRSR